MEYAPWKETYEDGIWKYSHSLVCWVSLVYNETIVELITVYLYSRWEKNKSTDKSMSLCLL